MGKDEMATMIQIERALDALGYPTRRAVFKRLRRGNRSVQEIADGMEVSLLARFPAFESVETGPAGGGAR